AALAQWALGAPAALGDDVIQAFAGIHVTPAQIALHLGRAPTSHDTKALKEWYRALKTGKAKAPVAPAADSFLDDEPEGLTAAEVESHIRAADSAAILD